MRCEHLRVADGMMKSLSTTNYFNAVVAAAGGFFIKIFYFYRSKTW